MSTLRHASLEVPIFPAGIQFCESDGPLALDTPSATPNDPDYPCPIWT